MLSPDARYLALLGGMKESREMGIDDDVFYAVGEVIEKHGGAISNRNPMSGMF